MRFEIIEDAIPTTGFFKTVISIDAEDRGGLLVLSLSRGQGRLYWLLSLNNGTFKCPEWGVGVLTGTCSYESELLFKGLLRSGTQALFDAVVQTILKPATEGPEPEKSQATLRTLSRYGISLW